MKFTPPPKKIKNIELMYACCALSQKIMYLDTRGAIRFKHVLL